MLHRLIIALLTCLSLTLLISPLTAQETPPPDPETAFKLAEGWTFEQRCIQEATPPPAGWTFDGTIFIYEDDRGMKELRSDVAQPYFIAFDGGSEPQNFNAAGRVSPDGKWYAVPAGTVHSSMTGNHYGIDEIRVFSTGRTSNLIHRVSWSNHFAGISTGTIDDIQWKDNTTLFYQDALSKNPGWYEFNVLDGNKTLVEVSFPANKDGYHELSPDLSMGIKYREHADTSYLVDLTTGQDIMLLPHDYQINWLPDSSGFLLFTTRIPAITRLKTILSENRGRVIPDASTQSLEINPLTTVELYNRRGELVTQILNTHEKLSPLNWSPYAQVFALQHFGEKRSLYIMDFEQQLLIATCIQNYYLFQWSPHEPQILIDTRDAGQQNAILQVINWQTGENYRIATIPNWIVTVGWHPNEKAPNAANALQKP